MFQPIRAISGILLVPATFVAVALTSQSAASASALPASNWHMPSSAFAVGTGNYHATTTGVVHHAPTTGVVHHAPTTGVVHHAPTTGVVHHATTTGVVHYAPTTGVVHYSGQWG